MVLPGDLHSYSAAVRVAQYMFLIADVLLSGLQAVLNFYFTLVTHRVVHLFTECMAAVLLSSCQLANMTTK